MKKNKLVKSLGLVVGVLSLYSTTALADEVSKDVVQELPETVVVPETVVTVPEEEPVTAEDVVLAEETPAELEEISTDEGTLEESEQSTVEVPEGDLPIEESSENVAGDEETPIDLEEVTEKEEDPEESGDSTELDNLKKYTNESISYWFNEGLITQDEYDKITADILNATTSEEIDVLFTKFYDEVIVPPVLVVEEIIKGYEDEIASWVTAGYIDQEGELFLLELLNSLDSIEEMDEFMAIIRELLAELDNLDDEDDDVVIIEEEKEIKAEDKSKPTYELINTNQNNKPKNNVTNVTYKVATKSQESLPKTGEEQNVAVAFSGMMMVALFGRVYLKKQGEL